MKDVRQIIKILLSVLFIIIAVKFFIYLLPFIFIGILVYLIYIRFKDKNEGQNNYAKESSKFHHKKMIGEAEIISERIEKE